MTDKPCSAKHMPYKHISDEECYSSILYGRNANKKTYYCMLPKGHRGYCEDIDGNKWNPLEGEQWLTNY